MDALWPDLDSKSQSSNLHRALHFARRPLASAPARPSYPYLLLRGDLLSLCPDSPLWVDVQAFEEAATVARRFRDPAVYRAAIELYASELLPEDLYEEWTQEKRYELRATYLTLLLEMAGLYEEREEYGPAIEALGRVVAEDPGSEESHVGLMRLYASSGRRREAILQYARLREALLKELDEGPGGASRRLYENIRSGRFPAISSPTAGGSSRTLTDSSPNNLPAPLTSFVGREREMLAVRRSLSMTRLMTLTGAGGAGKTRLALEAARNLVGAYQDGVWLAELAPHSDPALAPRAVMTTLGVREQPDKSLTQTLCDYLASRQALLVLDNCEHMVDAAAGLAKDLLLACPRLRMLATSREPLGVPGETIWPVPPLSLPEPETDFTVNGLMRCEAGRLFVERARSRLPAFELTPKNAPAVARICRKLDGIPLAIELSTARMGTLAVEQVAERLEDSLGLLTGGDRTVEPRHRTLRATLDWSYGLLSGPEKALFRRLSVFAGGFTLEAAEAVGAGGIEQGEVLDPLSRLVDKSIVAVEATGEDGLRYGMLEPARQYGRERLAESGEADAVRRRHASWCFRLAQKIEPWLREGWQETWLVRLERECGNLRAALDWALENGETHLVLWFGGALAEFWYMSGDLSESRRWLEAALAGDDEATPARVKALVRAGWISWEQGDYERSVALSEESLALSRELGYDEDAVAALSSLGWATLLGGALERASALSEEAVALGRAIGDTGGVARALLVPGLAAVVRGEHAQATMLHRESLAMAREAGDGIAMALSLGMGVFASLGRGDNRQAKALLAEGIAVSPTPRVMVVTAFHLHASAALAGSLGQPARSARLWGAAEALREHIGAALSPVERRTYEPYMTASRASLGEEAWEEAWAEGREMTVEEAVDHALARETPAWQPRHHSPEPAPAGAPEALTYRELEIALLVAGERTNRQIAEELSISGHTVAAHVRSVLKKLKLRSRTQVASRL